MSAPAPECAALAEGLRELRARTGLSLAALAERTAYSKSSWERCLNGRTPVPRHAVEALCAIAGEPTGRLLALWELADAEWSGRARQARPSGPPAPSPPSPSLPTPAPVPTVATGSTGSTGASGVQRRPRRGWLFVLVATGVAAAAIASIPVLTAPRSHDAGPPPILRSPVLDPAPGCRADSCDGRDPDEMSCGLPGRDDSLGAQHHTATGTRVEVRYSSVCAAAWGRIWHSKVGDTIEISALGTRPQRFVVTHTTDTDAYRFTPMIGAPARTGLRLCFIPAGDTSRECFDI
ncbi:helix-turn-helix domain-containing protein [Embleya hyalina]|uniref:HTH cro/C1-type domain-containing protein n=1 Tax=Embleya hyalina TaxID=516124 RepID=A0A401YWW9_9ACTN|nr:XRE family transcriptional regulator [Embleya hyalina]GCD99117.1 hypothetical protein EHYA_06829 [Embleya hyalina]